MAPLWILTFSRAFSSSHCFIQKNEFKTHWYHHLSLSPPQYIHGYSGEDPKPKVTNQWNTTTCETAKPKNQCTEKALTFTFPLLLLSPIPRVLLFTPYPMHSPLDSNQDPHRLSHPWDLLLTAPSPPPFYLSLSLYILIQPPCPFLVRSCEATNHVSATWNDSGLLRWRSISVTSVVKVPIF